VCVSNFNTFSNGLHELNELAMLGEPATYKLVDGMPETTSQWYRLITLALNGEDVPELHFERTTATHEWAEITVFIVLYCARADARTEGGWHATRITARCLTIHDGATAAPTRACCAHGRRT
jgi:hypothetical protein